MRYFPLFAISVCLASGQSAPGTLTLRQAVELAATASPAIEIGKLKENESNVNAAIAASAQRPQITAHIFMAGETNNLAAIGLSIPGFTNRLGPFRVFDARPVLSQTLIDMSLRSRIKAARERAGQSRLDAEGIREEVQLAVLEFYLLVFEAESRLRASQKRLDSANALAGQSMKLANSGEGSKLDLARVLVQVESERISMITARKDRELMRTSLFETIGLEPNASLTLAPPEEPNLSGPVVSVARPDVEALELRIKAAKLDEEAARRERLPKLLANASYGALGAGPDRALSTFAVSGTLSFPIWTGGRIEGERAAAALRVRELELELKRLKLAVARETERASIELSAARDAARAAAEAAAAAKTSLELVRLRLGAGMATSLDIVTAESRLADAEEMEIRLRYNALLMRGRLARAHGKVMAYFD